VKDGVFQELAQAQHRELFLFVAEGAGQVLPALHDGGGQVGAEGGLTEAAKAKHFVDHQAGRHVAVIDHQDARQAREQRGTAGQVLAQVDDWIELAAGCWPVPAPSPSRRARAVSGAGTPSTSRAFLARHQVQLAGHAYRDSDPLRAGGVRGLRAGGRAAATPFELREQFVRPVAQCL